MSPQRIQRKRTRGWKMPEDTVYVGRGSKWGNPHKVGDTYSWFGWGANLGSFIAYADITQESAVHLYRRDVLDRVVLMPSLEEIRAELAGKNLACWCPESQPCHADVLLELANGGTA